jgi:hypothetical protein
MGRWVEKKLDENVDLAIRSEGAGEKVIVEEVLRAVAEDDAESIHHAAQRAPDHPYLARQLSGVRPAQIRKGATQAVVGCLVGGLGPKSVGGSSWMNSELDEYGKDTRDFRLVQTSGE